MKLNYKNWQFILFISLRYEWKNRRADFRTPAIQKCARRFFIHTSRKRKKNNNQFLDNLIFFMFIRFPAILLVKTIHISMNFVYGVFYIVVFSNMAQRQRAWDRVAGYVIVNNVTTATLESKSKNAWKRHWQKRNGNSLNSLYLGVSNSFKNGSSKLNNHSANAVGKFILALSVRFEFCFIV